VYAPCGNIDIAWPEFNRSPAFVRRPSAPPQTVPSPAAGPFLLVQAEQLEARMDEIAHRVARDRTNATRERTSTDEAQRFSN
jgi:hypothetical protein